MSPIVEPAPTHVPAWKKLGLKLKLAKEGPDNSTKDQNNQRETVNARKRKADEASDGQSVEVPATERPKKKPKRAKVKKSEVNGNHDANEKPLLNGDGKASSPKYAIDTAKTIRKSVSFAPEAKIEDGEGSKELYSNWLNEQLAIDPSFKPSNATPALKSITPFTVPSEKLASQLKSSSTTGANSTSETSSKKRKRQKREKPKKKPDTSPPNLDHPALAYLTAHHASPTTWKFSKPHQNYLIKHLFSLPHLPPSYDLTLLDYLTGLQGSAARSRIRQKALTIRSEDDEWLSTAEVTPGPKMDNERDEQGIARRKRDYEAAVARMKQQLKDREDEREEREWELLGDREDWERRLKRRKRAEVVLWGVGEEAEEEEEKEKEVVQEPIPPPKPIVTRERMPLRAEPVTIQSRGMGGVERISVGGIAKGSVGKKIVFGDEDGDGMRKEPQGSAVNGAGKTERRGNLNISGVRPKRRRRGKKRTTGVPDDDDSSSESSSSSSSSGEERQIPRGGMKRQVGRKGASKPDSESSSGNSSDESHSDSD